jgi:hypothetical protein
MAFHVEGEDINFNSDYDVEQVMNSVYSIYFIGDRFYVVNNLTNYKGQGYIKYEEAKNVLAKYVRLKDHLSENTRQSFCAEGTKYSKEYWDEIDSKYRKSKKDG